MKIAKPIYKYNVMKKELESIACCTEGKFGKVLTDPTLSDYMMMQCLFGVDKEKLLCKVLALVPDLVITINEVKNFGVVNNELTKRIPKSKEFQTGFLTLDREGRAVLLHQSDSRVKVYAIIGIWIADPDSISKEGSVKSSLTLGAMLRFLFMGDIKARTASQTRGLHSSYLLIDFSDPAVQFYEFRPKERDNSWLLLEFAHDISMEENFRPISFCLDRRSGHYRSYKFSHIVSLNAETRSRSHRQKCKTLTRENIYFSHYFLSKNIEINKINTQRLDEQSEDGKITLKESHDVTNAAHKFELHSVKGPIKILKLHENHAKAIKGALKALSSDNSQRQLKIKQSNQDSKSVITPIQKYNKEKTELSSIRYDKVDAYSDCVKSTESSASAHKNAPYLGRIVIEQQKQIQDLQQQLSSLAKIMQEMSHKKTNPLMEDYEKMLNNKVRGRNVGDSKTLQNLSKPMEERHELTLSPEMIKERASRASSEDEGNEVFL
eukprot:TRINITY_DN1518_c0_g1_i6.p1 TRINITY_DN1518_c0_g1~~TRINITY_DN1518_c0_g1_i6.p1  ORF type:complete len:493 (-),score=48.86 TRINITY_DN1518_c0_g1_i6:117-1595(-)